MYYDWLRKISESSEELGDTAGKDLYALKARRFQNYVSENIIYKNDILLHLSEIDVSFDKKTNNLMVELKFQLRNNSPFNIKNLTAELKFKEKNEVIKTYDKEIFAYENIFPMGQQTAIIKLNTELNKKNLNPKEDTLNVDFYLYKKENHKFLAKHFQIKKPVELLK